MCSFNCILIYTTDRNKISRDWIRIQFNVSLYNKVIQSFSCNLLFNIKIWILFQEFQPAFLDTLGCLGLCTCCNKDLRNFNSSAQGVHFRVRYAVGPIPLRNRKLTQTMVLNNPISIKYNNYNSKSWHLTFNFKICNVVLLFQS